jgi:hypothetical protein
VTSVTLESGNAAVNVFHNSEQEKLETAAMSIAFISWNNWAAITGRFVRIDRQAEKTGSQHTQEIYGPALTLAGLGLYLICVLLIPA